jgi:antitoxin (DNA-binding transcriptional repressor) of toxin-antitoxin stability system
MNTPTIVSMKDIRLSLAAIARRVEAGERFVVVKDFKPVFQIEPLSGFASNRQRGMAFTAFTKKIDSVRNPGETEWIPDAVEKVIQEMYRERTKRNDTQEQNKATTRKRRRGHS